jgi:hypothetical protein
MIMKIVLLLLKNLYRYASLMLVNDFIGNGFSKFSVHVFRLIINIVGISNVKSRESLVMTYTDMAEDPFSSAPFSLPGK